VRFMDIVQPSGLKESRLRCGSIMECGNSPSLCELFLTDPHHNAFVFGLAMAYVLWVCDRYKIIGAFPNIGAPGHDRRRWKAVDSL
jgi:hypothetical protein